MMSVKEIREWLSTLPDGEYLGICDGGLILTTPDASAWLEIGGCPEGSEGAKL